jgi:hypothetical protein
MRRLVTQAPSVVFALISLVGAIVASLSADAQSTFPTPKDVQAVTVAVADFEEPSNPPGWTLEGGAGFDWGKGFAHYGVGNAWVRATTGWNSISTIAETSPNMPCQLQAWVQVSNPSPEAVMAVQTSGAALGSVIKQETINNHGNSGYVKYAFTFTPTATGTKFYVGLTGNGKDAWLRVDDVSLICQAPACVTTGLC